MPPGIAAEPKLAPFLKWAGGKRSLLPRILPLVPRKIDVYYEPFLGGGALFFELARLGRIGRAVLADRNRELIVCYEAIRDDVEGVMRALDLCKYEEKAYYAMRDLDPASLSPVASAARTIYLNKTGFNGLYRVNSSGRFNVPFGHFPTARRFYDPLRLAEVSRVLKTVDLRSDDFETVVAAAKPGDFVYFDPPYVPLSQTSSFTAYGQQGFGDRDQQRLADLLRRLRKAKVAALLSNSDCDYTQRLYKGLRPVRAEVRRAINSVGDRRGPVSELLVRSFAYPC